MNAILSRAVGVALDALCGDFPKTIRIETTNACNAKCVICPHGQMSRPVQRMPDALFDKIVRECAAAGVDTLHLHNFGEPLIDKRLPERVALCKSLGIRRVKLFSNGSIISEDKARALVAAGLDEIKISFDGATREEFERIRTPLKFDEVVGNVVRLVEIRDQMKAGLRVEVTCSATTDKGATMALLEKAVDGFSFGRIHNWAGWDDPNVAGAVKPGWLRKPCARVWQTFTVLANGDVALCCLDYDGSVILGNVAGEGESIRGIWRNEAYARVRDLHRSGRQGEIAICAGCSKSFW